MWDGAEQAQFSLDDTRRSTGRFEIHMNTMGWKISDNIMRNGRKMLENLLEHLKLALLQCILVVKKNVI